MTNTPYSSDWFVVTPLAPGLFGIAEPYHYEWVNSFLLVAGEEAILIDSGMGLRSIRELVTKITPAPCRVINTHSDFDHVGSNHEFSSVSLFNDRRAQVIAQRGFTAEQLAPQIRGDKFTKRPPTDLRNPYEIPPFPHARFFDHGAVFTNSSFNLLAIHCPGHTDDSVCFWEPQRKWLFAGDLLYDGPIYLEARGGLGKYRESLAKIESLNPEIIFASHDDFVFPISKLQFVTSAVHSVPGADLDSEIRITWGLSLSPSGQND